MHAELLETQKHYLAVPNGTGDIKTIWDPNVPEEVDNAREQFNKLRAQRYTIYRSEKSGERGEVMHAFDASVRKMIAVKAVVGG